jgi:hypothetical protein
MIRKRHLIILAMLILFVLSGCGFIQGKAIGNTPTTYPPMLTPGGGTGSIVIVGTAELVGTSLPEPVVTLHAGTPPPISFPPEGGLIIGLQDQGRTVVMHVGDRFLLQLGDGYNWTITSSDDSVVGRVINIMVISGSQGLYEGRKVGDANLNMVGDPSCRSSQPPCEMPSMSFTLHVQVEP